MLQAKENEMVITRIFDAPRELMWKVWTEPEHIAQWWGPIGFTNTIHEMHVKEGGVWRLTMHGPDGTDFLNKIIYLEVKKPELLVYRHSGEGETDDISFHVRVLFEDENGKTKLTMSMTFESKEKLDRVKKEFGAEQGQIDTMNRLGAYIKNINS